MQNTEMKKQRLKLAQIFQKKAKKDLNIEIFSLLLNIINVLLKSTLKATYDLVFYESIVVRKLLNIKGDGNVMPLYINGNGKQLLFIHIPKTAGTTLKNSVCSDVQVILDAEFKKTLPCPPQHFHKAVLKQLRVFDLEAKKMAIVRHPTSRFVSEYAYRRKVDRKFRFLSIGSFTWFCIKTFEFNKYILSNHIRPQHEFIDESVQIFKLEESGVESAILSAPEFFNENEKSLVHRNKSGSSEILCDKWTLAAIEQFYQGDFEVFGYDKLGITAIKKGTYVNFLIQKIIGSSLAYLYRLIKR